MLNLIRHFFGGQSVPVQTQPVRHTLAAPIEIAAAGAPAFRIAEHLSRQQGYPIMAWDAASRWIGTLAPADQAPAWIALERTWLLHLRVALGDGFRLAESDNCLLLSALEDRVANATLAFMERTLKRVVLTPDGIAEVAPWGKDILVVFDDEDSYYRYVSTPIPRVANSRAAAACTSTAAAATSSPSGAT